jgi:hypothetical protein
MRLHAPITVSAEPTAIRALAALKLVSCRKPFPLALPCAFALPFKNSIGNAAGTRLGYIQDQYIASKHWIVLGVLLGFLQVCSMSRASGEVDANSAIATDVSNLRFLCPGLVSFIAVRLPQSLICPFLLGRPLWSWSWSPWSRTASLNLILGRPFPGLVSFVLGTFFLQNYG